MSTISTPIHSEETKDAKILALCKELLNRKQKGLGEKSKFIKAKIIHGYAFQLKQEYRARKFERREGGVPKSRGELSESSYDRWSVVAPNKPGDFDVELPETCTTVVCEFCHGSKKCEHCHGTGAVRCSSCEGTKKCHSCGGHGEDKCDVCGGRGDVRCSVCDGSGNAWVKQQTIKCERCYGTGRDPRGYNQKCSSCGGSGKKEIGEYVICPNCRGTGRITCKKCKGEGRVSCRACHGDGKCYDCDGAGVVACNECLGERECQHCHGTGEMAYTLHCIQHETSNNVRSIRFDDDDDVSLKARDAIRAHWVEHRVNEELIGEFETDGSEDSILTSLGTVATCRFVTTSGYSESTAEIFQSLATQQYREAEKEVGYDFSLRTVVQKCKLLRFDALVKYELSVLGAVKCVYVDLVNERIADHDISDVCDSLDVARSRGAFLRVVTSIGLMVACGLVLPYFIGPWKGCFADYIRQFFSPTLVVGLILCLVGAPVYICALHMFRSDHKVKDALILAWPLLLWAIVILFSSFGLSPFVVVRNYFESLSGREWCCVTTACAASMLLAELSLELISTKAKLFCLWVPIIMCCIVLARWPEMLPAGHAVQVPVESISSIVGLVSYYIGVPLTFVLGIVLGLVQIICAIIKVVFLIFS